MVAETLAPPLPVVWHCIRLPRDDYAAGESDVVTAVFRAGFIARNGPQGAALFGGWAADRQSFLLYFTPAARCCAEALLRAYSAEPCSQPAIASVEWLSGDHDVRVGQMFEF